MPCRTGVWRILAISLVAIGLAATAASAEITPTTRGTLAYLIAHSVGGFESFTPPAEPTFSDVPPGYCLYAEIKYAYSLGIMLGYMGGVFNPDNVIWRDTMSAFTARVLDLIYADFDSFVPPDSPTFPDVPPAHWYYTYVEYMVAKGVTPDSSDGLFHPLSEMDVYEAADWLQQATGTYVDPDTIPPCDGATGSIGGTVTDAETGNPIASATVTCEGFSTTTEADGTYLLPDLPEAEGYTVAATAPSYYGSVTGVSVIAGQTTVVDLALNRVEVIETYRGSFPMPRSVSANPTDGSCWVAHGTSSVVHLDAEGNVLSANSGFRNPQSVSANSADGSCWVADWTLMGYYGGAVWKLRADGGILFSKGFSKPVGVAVDSSNGSCWVVDPLPPTTPGDPYTSLIHLSENGSWLGSLGYELWQPEAVSANPADGSCWVADTGHSKVAHVSANLQDVVSYSAGFELPKSVSVNPADGSCWVADYNHHEVVHFSETGLSRYGGFRYPRSVSVNPTDGSCWVADTGNDQVVLVSENGVEIWRASGFDAPECVSANPTDGSCWVADTLNAQVVHLVITILHRLSVTANCTPSTVSSAATTSCTATFSDSQGHGIASWSWSDGGAGGTFSPSAAVQNPTYTAPANTTGADILVHLTVTATCDGPSPLSDSDTADLTVQPSGMFSDVPPGHWACAEIGACVNAGIVQGYSDGTYQPAVYVSRDQMAVYISRALAGGESNVPEFTGTPSFTDVPLTWWALKHIEYAVANNVVQGYQDNTYHPEDIVDRAQMAVYVARAMVAPQGDAAFDTYIPVAPRNFPDVPSDSWGYKQIEYCVEHGVVQGYDDNLYHPEREVTRAQMAVYVCRAFGLLP